MRILVACEESQRVCIEFRRLGHEAYSCDIEPCSGGCPEWHIQDDAIPLLDGNCGFQTADGAAHMVYGKWDMIIAFPPCTYLSNAGARHLWKNHELNQERYEKGLAAKEFFMKIYNADCERIAIENPTPSRIYGLPEKSQVIQPYQFGHPYTKRTQLWLKGLPLLEPSEIVEPVAAWCPSGSYCHTHEERSKGVFTTDRAKNRAKAMAAQWGRADAAAPECPKAPRRPLGYYGLTDERVRELESLIRSGGAYAAMASQAAHAANETIAEYILTSVRENKSYDALSVKWDLGERERMPYGKTDFYGIRRYFFSIFDKELRRRESDGSRGSETDKSEGLKV